VQNNLDKYTVHLIFILRNMFCRIKDRKCIKIIIQQSAIMVAILSYYMLFSVKECVVLYMMELL